MRTNKACLDDTLYPTNTIIEVGDTMNAIMICVNQNDNNIPYKFAMTGMEVYTFEEALYHTFTYWKESMEDFSSPEFISWVKNTLDLKYIASQIAELKKLDSAGGRLLGFLSLTQYYNEETLAALKAEMSIWEARLEWERLKDMGDMFMEKGEAQKAHNYYKRALMSGEDIKLLNNMGVCLMRLEMFDIAVEFLSRAYEMDKNDFNILINYAEGLIYKGDFELAFTYLRKAERDGEKAVVSYLYGKLCQENNNLTEALSHYERAAALEYDPFYYYTLAGVYTKIRKFNKALEVLENIKNKDRAFYIHQAEIYASFEDYAAAVKCMEKAVVYGERNNSNLWAILAKYHRLNYDMDRAARAAFTALNIDANNKLARLEMARIKKAQGKLKDYQKSLSQVLDTFKHEYRNIADTGN